MIGTQTPFRVSFAGGGSDLRAFYSREPGRVLSTTINKYVYILIHPFFEQKYQIKYSRTEIVDSIDDIQHPVVREALRRFDITGVDINSIADIPAGTGLGSSSSFTVGLLHALHAYAGIYPSREHLARRACEIEIDILKEPIGKQDQYPAAYGGLNFITFHPNETVSVEPVYLPRDKYDQLQDNLLLFYTGKTRDTRAILIDQRRNILSDRRKFENMRKMVDLAVELRDSLRRLDLGDFGRILHEDWLLKRSLSRKISSPAIDDYYDTALRNGASGGKVLGAGGGGFILLYCEKEKQDRLRRALSSLREVDFRFEAQGTKVFFVGER